MRKLIVQVAALAAVALQPAPLSAHDPGPQPSETASLPAAAQGPASTVDAFHAALRRGDTGAASALLDEDAVIFESGGVERSKAEYAGHHLPADAAFSQAVTSIVTRRTGNVSGALAWIASEGQTSGNYQGKTVDLVTTETMLLRRVGKEWRIAHIHWSSGKRR